ncbi:MAG: hypothetical protein JSW18_01975 [Candidatus Omnitrophota bacterium]|nr:MAG: hypothetical protein JSW18_01975 [Candidatus Omnitrophota bacterium]
MIVAVCIIFFLSGTSALIFESLFFRLAGLTFGSGVHAISIVLASFMGGLALGSALVTFFGHRIRFPIRFYALLEGIIAVSGYAIVLLFPHFTRFFAPIFSFFVDKTATLNFLRAIFAIGLMLVPTTAMGATLPILVRALNRRRQNFGNVLGMLYGWNTFGAVFGVFANEFLFIIHLGIRGAGLLAAMLNITSVVIALIISQKAINGKHEMQKIPLQLRQSYFSFRTIRFLIASFLSGFILLSLEVVWFRFMLLFYPSSSLLFAIMLGVVLIGISSGGLFASHLFKIKMNAHHFLIFVLAINGILICILYPSFDSVFAFAQRYIKDFGEGLCSFYLMFPISFMSGIIFTMLGRFLHDRMGVETMSSGFLTMANTIGAACGSLITGLLCIPLLGIEGSFFLFATLYGSIILFVIFAHRYNRLSVVAHAVMISVFFVSLAAFPFGLMKETFLPSAIALNPFDPINKQVVASREGINETIQYIRVGLFDKPHYYRLITNSHGMSATNLSAKRYMNLFAYWPMVLHPELKNALLIGYGCGNTAKALVSLEQLESLDVVDTSKDIFEMSSIVFPHPKEDPLYDRRVRVYVEDGRFFLLTRNRRYDLITAEPPPPKNNGVVNLYTREYFQLIYDRLADGGMVTYWLPVEELEPSEAKAILQGFCNVFNNCSLWAGTLFDWMVVGIKEPQKSVSTKEFVRPWNDPVIGSEMKSLGFRNPQEFGALFIADRVRILEWISQIPPLVDNYPLRISHRSPSRGKITPVYLEFMHPNFAQKNFLNSTQIKSFWPEKFFDETAKFFPINFNALSILRGINPYKKLHFCLRNPEMESYILWAVGSDEYAQRIVAEAIATRRDINELGAYEHVHLAARAIKQHNYLLAEHHYSIATSLVKDPQIFQLRMYLLYLTGNKVKANQVKQEYINLYQTRKDVREEEMKRFWRWLEGVFPKEHSNQSN